MSKELIASCLRTLSTTVAGSLTKSLSKGSKVYCAKRIENLFEHSVVGGKCSRSRLLLSTFNALETKASKEQILQVANVAACIEILQAFFLIFDDVMDNSTTRRGKPCWYTMPGIGLSAVNDGLILDSAINEILNDNLRNHPNKDAVMNVFAKARKVTTIGQMLDGATDGVKDCTWERYSDIVLHKTAYYTCYAPLRAAMLLADCTMYGQQCKEIAFKMGYLFQAQDDYLDCFGDPSITGKIGTDLKDGKCTWVTCKAAEKTKDHPDQRRLFEGNFGKSSDESETIVKGLLRELRVQEDFVKFEETYSKNVLDDIDDFVPKELRNVLTNFSSELLHRNK